MTKASRLFNNFDCRYALVVSGAVLAMLLGARPALPHDLNVDEPAAQKHALHAADRRATPARHHRVALDDGGRVERGKASVYSRSFDGKKMANGEHYDPQAHVAASKSLPIGTVAKVTNLENGKSTEVRVADRGPFVDGRVVDLTPRAAADIGLSHKEGVAPVVVAPVGQAPHDAAPQAQAERNEAAAAPAQSAPPWERLANTGWHAH